MGELLTVIGTSWPNIRVALYRRDDGLYQFVEEHFLEDAKGHSSWQEIDVSGLYDDVERAKADMVPFVENIETS